MAFRLRNLWLFALVGLAGLFGVSCHDDDDDDDGPAMIIRGPDTDPGTGDGDGDGDGDTDRLGFAFGSGFSTGSASLTQQPATIMVDVPAGAEIKQVILYWDTPAGDPDGTIGVDGNDVAGSSIRQGNRINYRSDITGLGLVAPGSNTLTLDGLDVPEGADAGAAVVVIYDDGTGLAEQQFRDSSSRGVPDEEVVEGGSLVHRFKVGSANVERTANLSLLLSDGGAGGAYDVVVNADGNTLLSQPLTPGDAYWDNFLGDLQVPSGTENIEVIVTPRDGGDPNDIWLISGLRFACTATIAGVFVDDLNHNGVQDDGEGGLAGVEVSVENEAGDVLGTVTTDADGRYEFSGLCQGSHRVVVNPDTLPEDVKRTDCTDDADGTEEGRCDFFSVVVLETNDASEDGLNFSFTGPCSGSLGDLVWHDTNENGTFEAGEPGIEAVTLLLKRGGVIVDVIASGRDGLYEFSDVCGGDYVIEVDAETLPTEFTPAPCNVGPDTKDNDCSPASVSLAGNSVSDPTLDFAYVSACSGGIFGTLTVDVDGDTLRGEGATALEGVLLVIRDEKGNLVGEVTSNPAGFRFEGLCAGQYVIEFDASTVRPGLQAKTCRFEGGPVSRDCASIPFEISADENVVGPLDYNFLSGCSSTIRGAIWNDETDDGFRRGIERGFEGLSIRVILRGPKGDRFAETTTGALGDYAFVGLCAGDFTVNLDPATLPPGFVQGTCSPPPQSIRHSTCLPADITLVQNFGQTAIVSSAFRSELVGKFLGRIVNDINGDGVRGEDEPGIAGVKVFFRDQQGRTIARFTSRPSGSFDFGGIAPGTYEVEIDPQSLPAGFTQVTCGEFEPGSLTSVCSPATIVIPDSSDVVEVNFGYTGPAKK